MRESSQTASIRGKLVIGHSIQLGVFRLGFSEDWDVTIGIFPDGEKLLSLISRPEAGKEVHGSQERVAFEVFLIEIDEQLKRCVNGPDQERDRMIFWLYFRQGMSTKEIASLPTIGLGAKGVGSVIERLKHAKSPNVSPGHKDFCNCSLVTTCPGVAKSKVNTLIG